MAGLFGLPSGNGAHLPNLQGAVPIGGMPAGMQPNYFIKPGSQYKLAVKGIHDEDMTAPPLIVVIATSIGDARPTFVDAKAMILIHPEYIFFFERNGHPLEHGQEARPDTDSLVGFRWSQVLWFEEVKHPEPEKVDTVTESGLVVP